MVRLRKPLIAMGLWMCVVGLVLAMPFPAHAQTKLEEGETVKVFYLNSWFDGVVLGREKNRYGVEFEFAGTKKREMFERAQLRKECEVDAIDLARMWENASGKFKIEAALKGFHDEAAVLNKVDGNQIEVPIASLSEKDQLYLKKFKKQFDDATNKGMVPASVPPLPELKDFGGVEKSSIAAMIGEGAVTPLGPVPTFLREFQHSGTGFYFARDGQEIVASIPVGGPEQWVLVTAREENFHNRGVEFQSQAYWVSLKQKKVVCSVAITPEDYIVDYDPKSKRLLSVHTDEVGKATKNGAATLWSLKPGEAKAEPLVRWSIPRDVFSGTDFAKIINQDIVLAKTDSQTYVGWNIPTESVAYSIKAASFFDAPVVLSADRKSLIVPEDGKVTVINTIDGSLRFSLPVKDRHVSGANINQDGNRLCALTEQNVYVWDLDSEQPEPKIHAAPLIGSPFASRIEWVDDDHLMAESQQERVLYRLSLQLPVWSYRMDVSQYWLNRDPLTNQVLNGLFFYVAQPDRFRGSVAIGAASLPGPKVEELTKNIDRKSLMLLKAGTRVALQFKSVTDTAKVEQWLKDKIQKNGWIYDPNASLVMVAEMGVGKTQSETYREMGTRSGNTTTVTFTPHFANLTIFRGETIVWQTGTSTGPPPIISGRDLQSEVAKTEVPQLQFFSAVSIPSEIIDPKYSRGFGVSMLGLRGIEVVATSPPGREDDPNAAERKAEQDRNDARKNRN